MANIIKKIHSGFTVLEIIFVVVLLSLIVTAIAPYFFSIVSSWEIKDRQLEILQNGRVGIEEMTKTIKSATSFNTTAASNLTFVDADGNTTGFRLVNSTLEKLNSGVWTILAEPLSSLNFTYYDVNNNVTTSAASVRSVKIAMSVSDSLNKISAVAFNSLAVMRKDSALASLAINEINYNSIYTSASEERKHEWVEVYNYGSTDINMNGWIIVASGTSTTLSKWGSGNTTVAAGGYGIIVGSGSKVFDDYTYNASATKLTAGSSIGGGLNDNSDTITIQNSAGTNIDSVTYDDDWGGDGNGDTLERKNAQASPSVATNWEASSTTTTYTCGAANTVAP